MTRKDIATRILWTLTILTAIGSTIAYFVLEKEKPWLAFYVACCGGVLAFNFLASIFLLNRNKK